MIETKIDYYNHKRKYLNWKEKTKTSIEGISLENYTVLKRYLSDMESGLNVALLMKKGPRSFIRLNTIRIRMTFMMKLFQNRYNINNMTQVDEETLHNLLKDIRTGIIRKSDGTEYQSAKDYARDFKAFWHWHQKVSKKKGIELRDITEDLDTTGHKPKWVYLTEEQVRMLADSAKFEYKVLIWFLFDTGIRAPTELMNVRVADLHNDFRELNIRQEISKTFGRRIKLMICSNLIKEYIREKNLKPNDYLFKISPPCTNRYLKRLARRVIGEAESPARQKYSELTMYDFRHCASCYWLPRYKSESALKYRFGWKKSDKIHYYSELLGMTDTIGKDDMLLEEQKTELEKDLIKTKKENDILQEEMSELRLKLREIDTLTIQLSRYVKLPLSQ